MDQYNSALSNGIDAVGMPSCASHSKVEGAPIVLEDGLKVQVSVRAVKEPSSCMVQDEVDASVL